MTACGRASALQINNTEKANGIKESSAQWERWCLGMCIAITCEANAICPILHHRSTPQKWAHKLWAFGLCLWEICSWFRGFAVWSSQPTTSCKSVSEYIEGPLQKSIGHGFKSSFQDKNREKKTSSDFNTGTFIQPKHRSAVHLATCLKLLEQITWKPQAMKFQFCSKHWTPNLFFHFHKSTSDKGNRFLKDTYVSIGESTKMHHKIWSSGTACPVEGRRTAPGAPLRDRVSVCPITRSKISWQLQEQVRMLEISVRSIHFSDHYAI